MSSITIYFLFQRKYEEKEKRKVEINAGRRRKRKIRRNRMDFIQRGKSSCSKRNIAISPALLLMSVKILRTVYTVETSINFLQTMLAEFHEKNRSILLLYTRLNKVSSSIVIVNNWLSDKEID